MNKCICFCKLVYSLSTEFLGDRVVCMINTPLGKLEFVMLSHVHNYLLDMIRLLGVSMI